MADQTSHPLKTFSTSAFSQPPDIFHSKSGQLFDLIPRSTHSSDMYWVKNSEHWVVLKFEDGSSRGGSKKNGCRPFWRTGDVAAAAHHTKSRHCPPLLPHIVWSQVEMRYLKFQLIPPLVISPPAVVNVVGDLQIWNLELLLFFQCFLCLRYLDDDKIREGEGGDWNEFRVHHYLKCHRDDIHYTFWETFGCPTTKYS